MANEPDGEHSRHWVEDLFPPHYRFDGQELIEPTEEVTTAFDKVMHRIRHQKDIEEIQNVFERVLLLVKLTAGEGRANNNRQSVPLDCLVKTTSGQDQTTQTLQSDVHIRRSNTELWTESEMNLLRKDYYKKLKEHMEIKGELNITKQTFQDLQKKYEALLVSSNEMQSTIKHLNRQTEKLRILSGNLQEQVKVSKQQIVDTEDNLAMVTENRDELLKQAQNISMSLAKERMNRKLAETKLAKMVTLSRQEIDREKTTLTVAHEIEVSELTDRINRLTDALDNEQELHKKCKNGLIHLQKHFSVSPGIIRENDIKLKPFNQ